MNIILSILHFLGLYTSPADKRLGGYLYAAGELLAGTSTVHQLETIADNPFYDKNDHERGITQALADWQTLTVKLRRDVLESEVPVAYGRFENGRLLGFAWGATGWENVLERGVAKAEDVESLILGGPRRKVIAPPSQTASWPVDAGSALEAMADWGARRLADDTRTVKLSNEGVQFGDYWRSHEALTGMSTGQINDGTSPRAVAYRAWLDR